MKDSRTLEATYGARYIFVESDSFVVACCRTAGARPTRRFADLNARSQAAVRPQHGILLEFMLLYILRIG